MENRRDPPLQSTHPAIPPNPITIATPFTNPKETKTLGQTPFFQPAPPPTFTTAPSIRPQLNPFTTHNHTLQDFGLKDTMNPFQSHPNPFVTSRHIHIRQTPKHYTSKRNLRNQEGSRKGARKGN
jgi:hypothetical protein